jgi:hypothetical protein
VTEASEDRYQQSVARRQRGCQAGFDAGPGGAVDQQCPLVLSSEHAAIERHHLVHVGGELGVELALQGDRHRAEHPRIDVDRPWPHQQARLRIKLGEKLDRRSDLCGVVAAVGRLDLVRLAQKTSKARSRVRAGGVSYEASLANTGRYDAAVAVALAPPPFEIVGQGDIW